MNLTKDEMLVMLKKAYMRGVYEHAHQKYRSTTDGVGEYPAINIPNHVVEDLIQE